ncbi:MAG: hypothetical protein QF554_12545 [Dehalococcoidia bacterium]|nr:hypothetical protein [Dehalococcoidia bacterium]
MPRVKLALHSSVLLVFLLMLTACGSDDSRTASDAGVPAADVVSSASAAEPPLRPEDKDDPTVILNNVLASYVESFDGPDGMRFELVWESVSNSLQSKATRAIGDSTGKRLQSIMELPAEKPEGYSVLGMTEDPLLSTASFDVELAYADGTKLIRIIDLERVNCTAMGGVHGSEGSVEACEAENVVLWKIVRVTAR